MRWIKRLAMFVVTLFVVVPLIAYLMISTTAGSRLILNQAIKYAPVAIRYQEVNGALIDTFEITGLVIETATQRYTLDKLNVSWQPLALLDEQVTLDTLQLQHLTLEVLQADKPDETPLTLPTIALPFEVRITNFSFRDFTLKPATDADAATTYPLAIESRVRLKSSQLTLHNLAAEIQLPEVKLHHQGQLSASLSAGYPLQLDGTYAADFIDQRIPSVSGSVLLKGALRGEPLKLSSTFETADTPAQRLTAQLSDPLEHPSWLAKVELNQLPLPLLSPWLADYRPIYERYINASSTLSGEATVSPEQVQLRGVTARAIGEHNGELRVQGHWQHNNFTNDYQESPFELTLDFDQLAYTTDEFAVRAKQGLSSVRGTLNNYQFDSRIELSITRSDASLIDAMRLHVDGNGSLSAITLSSLDLASQQLDLNGNLRASWADTLDMNMQINSGRSNLGLSGEDVLLKGQMQLQNNELLLSDFAIQLNETQLTLNGSTAKDNLRGKIVINDLQKLPFMPEGLSELQALETEFMIDTQEQLSQFDLLFQNFSVKTASLDSWLLTQPTNLNFYQEKGQWLAQLNPLCLQHDANQFGMLCAELGLNADTIDASVNGERLSLWLLNRFRERDVAQRIAGLVTLNAQATLNRDTFEVREVALQLRSDNTVFFALNQETSTRLSYWELTARGNASQLSADLEGQLANNEGGLFGDVTITDLYAKRELQGSLLFSLDDLAMLDWVLPGMRYHGGKATAQLNLTGTMNEPSLNGDMEVYAESVVFAETNFVFNDVRLALIDRPDSKGELEIEGQAKAGNDGWLLVEGVAMPLDAEAYLKISGQNFRALQMPTATVDISPELTIHVNDRVIDIAGTVDVPYAAITAPDFETSVSNSNDVIVTRNGEPVHEDSDNGDGLAVNAQIRLNLGEHVSVDAYGFTGRLRGSLELVEEPRRPTTAVGSINVVDGSYELYGQELKIDRGAFIYNGGDISNPGLDLRVKRDITNGNSLRNVNVGAQVVGTLTEPDFRLFSTPAMPDSEILSYLILGKSMQSASATSSDDIQLQALLMLGAKGTDAIGESLQDTFGIDEFGIDNDPNTRETSFYIGKYLSPKLFVRYGVGLLESTNTFMVRYQLTERLLIETMASSQAQGGDIFYTFER